MDSEPPLIKKQTPEYDSSSFNNESDKVTSEEEDPYGFSSTSTSLIGLAIVFIMLGIPLLAVINERPASKKSTITTFLFTNGPESSSPITFSQFS